MSARKSSARRRAILEAAARVFGTYGPTKATVADIAREAAIGVGSVYLEFQSKGAILNAISRSRFEQVLAEMEADLFGEAPASERLARAMTTRAKRYRSFGVGPHDRDLLGCPARPIQEACTAHHQAECALLTRFLTEAHARSELVADDPPRLARALLVAYRSYAPPFIFEATGDVMDELRVMHTLVLRGLLPR